MVKLPYYTQIKSTDFKGFPFDIKDKKIILSGGAVYKTLGMPDFYEVINYILSKYPDTIFLYLGNNAERTIRNNLNNKTYGSRIFVLQERKDLNEIMKKSYLYINTFPLVGGLMTIFALNNDRIPLTLCNEYYPANEVSDFVKDCKYDFVFSDKENLIHEIDRLITDEKYYNKSVSDIKNKVITKEIFNDNLKRIILNEDNDFDITIKRFNYEYQLQNFKDNYKINFRSSCVASRSLFVFLLYPISFLIGLHSAVKRKYLD